ncbi:unnamed protein product [Caretta caretta]
MGSPLVRMRCVPSARNSGVGREEAGKGAGPHRLSPVTPPVRAQPPREGKATVSPAPPRGGRRSFPSEFSKHAVVFCLEKSSIYHDLTALLSFFFLESTCIISIYDCHGILPSSTPIHDPAEPCSE